MTEFYCCAIAPVIVICSGNYAIPGGINGRTPRGGKIHMKFTDVSSSLASGSAWMLGMRAVLRMVQPQKGRVRLLARRARPNNWQWAAASRTRRCRSKVNLHLTAFEAKRPDGDVRASVRKM